MSEVSPAATWPRSQRWLADGIRIGVYIYKSHRRDRCHACGQPGAIHWVSADGKGDKEGFSAMGSFCGEHRPAKGTLPDLDYVRHHWREDDDVDELEHLLPAAGDCGICGVPAICSFRRTCTGCDDPSRWRTQTSYIVSSSAPDRTESRRVHDQHTTNEWARCREHRDQLDVDEAW